MRCTLSEINKEGKVDEQGRLFLRGKEIGIVYYRSGYTEQQYCDANKGEWNKLKWAARELLECSLAIKCPSIDGQLITLKKFQQAFSDESLL